MTFFFLSKILNKQELDFPGNLKKLLLSLIVSWAFKKVMDWSIRMFILPTVNPAQETFGREQSPPLQHDWLHGLQTS